MRRLALLPLILIALTLVGVVMVFLISRQNVRQIQTLRDDSTAVSHTLEVLQQLDAVQLAVAEAQGSQSAYLLTDVEAYLTEYSETVVRLDTALTQLADLTRDNPDQSRLVERLRAARDRKIAQLGEGIDTRRARGFGAAASVMSDVNRPIILEIRAIATEMAAEEDRLLADRRARADAAFRSAVAGRIGSAVVTSFLIVGVALFAAARASSRARTTRIIAREREHLQVTLASIGDAVIATDVGGRVTLMNPIAATLTGWTPEEAAGRPIDEIFNIVDEQTRRPAENPVRRVLADGSVHGLADNTLLIARDGIERPVDDSGSPIRAADGQIRGAVLVFRDVTARRAHEQALRDSEQRSRQAARLEEAARKEAETANRLKDEFLAVLSHELRTPLNAVVGWAQILQRSAHDPTLARGLASIKRNADAQQRLVEDLLDVSRIVTGKFALERRVIDLCSPVSAAVDAVRPIAAAKGVDVFTELSGPALVSADQDRIQQAAANLLSNAVKFTPPAGRIDVALTTAEGMFVLSIADSGQGVAPDLLPFIFDRFRQGDASTTRIHGGLGLGLAIVKHIVDAHGGTIEARSDGEGRGSVFVARFAPAPTAERYSDAISEETS